MFSLAILLGIFSYIIFTLGLLSLLFKEIVVVATIIFIFFIIFYYRLTTDKGFYCFLKIERFKNIFLLQKKGKKFSHLLFLLILIQALINLTGVFGPELSFDALWYHLTLPKLYLINNAVIHVPGGLLYYSDMPKLTEMIYTAALSIHNETLAKLIHFSFGILSVIAIYKFSKKYFSVKISLLAILIFYSNLVVSWESTTAYVDLARTFFEVMALWGFINWVETKEKKWLVESAVMVGLAISTKLLAIGSIGIFLALILINDLWISKKIKIRNTIFNLAIFLLFSLLVPLPWFIFSLIHTGNPVYPVFSNAYKVSLEWQILNPIIFIRDMWQLFMRLADPISAIYILFLPLVILLFKNFRKETKLVTLYSLLAIIVWYVTPRTGGGRFILPYLSAFSIVTAASMDIIWKIRGIRILCIASIIIVFLISIVYRGVANVKYLPVILGKQTKSEFLTNNLNFSFGDFYDTDNYFRDNIKAFDNILLYGFHNLYYINFPFIDSSWVKRGDKFNYIAVQNTDIPERFKYWNLIYQNPKTGVKLYSPGGTEWVY